VVGKLLLKFFLQVTLHTLLLIFGKNGKASPITHRGKTAILFGISLAGLAIEQMNTQFYNVPKGCFLVLGFVADT
jgi:hypothetical protein